MIFIIFGVITGVYFSLTFLITSENERINLIISTTTSIYDTGLLDIIEEDFESKFTINLLFIPVGTGQALLHGQRGDSDLVLVHAPEKEFDFMINNYGVTRKIIAYNYFIIIGPQDDPAEIKGESVIDAMKKIVDLGRLGETIWISRGDDSGTHTREKSLWKSAGFEVSSLASEPWYLEAGSGMLSTLRVASEKNAYTLSDTGTFLKFTAGSPIDLEILVDQTKELINVYSAIAVNPGNKDWVNFEESITFIKYLISDEVQDIIANFRIDNIQKPLFFPAVKILETNSNEIESQWIKDIAFLNGYECPPQYRAGQDHLYP